MPPSKGYRARPKRTSAGHDRTKVSETTARAMASSSKICD
jgi:hypothetical protein